MSTEHLHVTQTGGTTVIELLDPKVYKLDSQVLDEIANVIFDLIASHPQPQILVDLLNCRAICSTMLAILIRAKKRVAEKQGRIALCSLQPLPHKLITLCRLDGVFDIYPDRTTALNQLNPA